MCAFFQGLGLDGKGDSWIERDSSGLGTRVTRGVEKDALEEQDQGREALFFKQNKIQGIWM